MIDQEKLRRWADARKSGGDLMEKFRTEDLHTLTDEEALWMFESMSGKMEVPEVPPRHDDGLIEQQRLFRRLTPHTP